MATARISPIRCGRAKLSWICREKKQDDKRIRRKVSQEVQGEESLLGIKSSEAFCSCIAGESCGIIHPVSHVVYVVIVIVRLWASKAPNGRAVRKEQSI